MDIKTSSVPSWLVVRSLASLSESDASSVFSEIPLEAGSSSTALRALRAASAALFFCPVYVILRPE